MKLCQYLSKHGLSLTAFSNAIDVTPESVRRYAAGERMPAPEIMRRIYDQTSGEVTANDFFGTPAPPRCARETAA